MTGSGISFFSPPGHLQQSVANPVLGVSTVPISGGGSGYGGSSLLDAVYGDLNAMAGSPTSRSESTQTVTTRQEPSPELEEAFRQFESDLNALSQQFTEAFNVKQGTYDDLIQATSDAFRTAGSDAMRASQQGALATGLTPLEASAAGQEANLNLLQAMYPQLAGLRTEQADVGVQLAKEIAALQSGVYLPFLSDVFTPYYRDVAGQVQTTETEQAIYDELARLAAMGNIASTQAGIGLERSKMGMEYDLQQQTFRQQQDQWDREYRVAMEQMEQEQAQFEATERRIREEAEAERESSEAMARAERESRERREGLLENDDEDDIADNIDWED